MTNHETKKLVYQIVYENLKKLIVSGHYPVGSFLPIEPELEKEYNVSRTTVRKATKLLADDGLVEIKQGRGTMVLDRKAPQSYNHVTSVTESLRLSGYDVQTSKRMIRKEAAPEEIGEALNMKLNEQVIHVQRIQTADGEPVCIMNNYIPEHLAPGMDQNDHDFVALYQYLEDRYGIVVQFTDDTIYAEGADFNCAAILDKEPGFPLLHINRVCYNAEHEPVCYDVVQILSNRYKVEINTSGRRK